MQIQQMVGFIGEFNWNQEEEIDMMNWDTIERL
jgi:hypothetical protein